MTAKSCGRYARRARAGTPSPNPRLSVTNARRSRSGRTGAGVTTSQSTRRTHGRSPRSRAPRASCRRSSRARRRPGAAPRPPSRGAHSRRPGRPGPDVLPRRATPWEKAAKPPSTAARHVLRHGHPDPGGQRGLTRPAPRRRRRPCRRGPWRAPGRPCPARPPSGSPRLLLDDAGGLEEAADAVGGLRALAEPVLHALEVDLHPALVVLGQQRVVGAELLDEAAVAGRARVGGDDRVVRTLLGPAAGEPDSSWPSVSLLGCCVREAFSRCLS